MTLKSVRRRAIFAATFVCFAAPVLAAEPPQLAAPPGPDEVYFVLGVEQDDALLEVRPVVVRDGALREAKFSLASHKFRAEGGYVVLKAHANELLAVESVSMMLGKTFLGSRFEICGKTPVFQSTGGKVVYVTSMDYESPRPSLGYDPAVGSVQRTTLDTHYSQDLSGARAFLKARYPSLADTVEQGRFDMLSFHGQPGCP